MKEELTLKLFRILESDPQSGAVAEFLRECSTDPALAHIWQDFLVEQHLAGNLSSSWQEFVSSRDVLRTQIQFQQRVQDEIRETYTASLRKEITSILPKLPAGTFTEIPNIRRLRMALTSAAAILLIVAGIWTFRILNSEEKYVLSHEGVPVLIVEPFELEGVTEDMLIHGIPQRLPAKLSVADGIYPISEFALHTVESRVGKGQQAAATGASYAVRGKLRKVESELQVEARLVNLSNNRAIWQESYKIPDSAKAFDDVQDALSLKIARTLNASVSHAAEERIKREVSRDPDAVGLFLAGERLWNKRTLKSIEQSINMFEMALDLDSSSTIIRGYLALAYSVFVENDWGDTSYWRLALNTASRTLDDDPGNPEALIVFGNHAFQVNNNYAVARGYFERALQAQPGDAKIHQAIAELDIRTGEVLDGIMHIRIARKLDPDHRVIRWMETKYLAATGELETAREAADDLIKIDPEFPNIGNFYWQYYLSKGMHAEALKAIPVYDSEYIWRTDYMRALTYLDQGDAAAFDEVYKRLVAGVLPTFDMLVHVRADRWDLVHRELREMLEEDKLELLPVFQTSDYAIFNKMKNDAGVRRILAEYGIRVIMIPKSSPEM